MNEDEKMSIKKKIIYIFVLNLQLYLQKTEFGTLICFLKATGKRLMSEVL